MNAENEQYPDWLVDVVRAFTPTVVPVDVTPEGTYLESTTRWAMNPVYERIPEALRTLAESTARPKARAYWNKLRDDWADTNVEDERSASVSRIAAERERVGVGTEYANRRKGH